MLLLWAFNSMPSVGDPPSGVPSAADLASIRALTAWVGGLGEFHALREGDVAAALGERRRGFQLFEREQLAERRLLSRLPYGGAISSAASRHAVDGLLLAAMVEAESGFDPDAISPRGAVGLLQVTRTAAPADADLFDPATNLDVGARYLSRLLKRYDGDLELALAAYNAGPGAVARFGGVPPYRETERYVGRVMERYAAHRRARG